MLRLLGWFLLLVGIGVMVYGIVNALIAIGGLYQGAMNNALDQPEGIEKDTSAAMLRFVVIGIGGLPALALGIILLIVARGQRNRERQNRLLAEALATREAKNR
jgi:hypothetical protein